MHKSKDLTRNVRLDIVAMHNKYRIQKFLALIQSVSLYSDTSASKSWSRIEERIYQNALDSLGKMKHTNEDWLEKHSNVLLSLIKIKRQAHVDYQHDPSSMSLKRLREAGKTFRKRKCANEFWKTTSADIKGTANRGNNK